MEEACAPTQALEAAPLGSSLAAGGSGAEHVPKSCWASSQMAANQVVTRAAPFACPQGHEFERFTSQENLFCNGCRRTFPIGTQMLGCHECDYDLCV